MESCAPFWPFSFGLHHSRSETDVETTSTHPFTLTAAIQQSLVETVTSSEMRDKRKQHNSNFVIYKQILNSINFYTASTYVTVLQIKF